MEITIIGVIIRVISSIIISTMTTPKTFLKTRQRRKANITTTIKSRRTPIAANKEINRKNDYCVSF